MRCFLLVCWLGIFAGLAHGQQAPTATAEAAKAGTLAPKRQLQAQRISTPPKLDGLLDEEVWQTAPIAGEFVENEPTPGRPEKHKTEVRVLYDDEAIYVGARMFDVSQDSILRELSQRDDIGNSDWFGVWFDTYHDKLNGYGFLVTSGGVQVDSRYSPAGGEDNNWNAVWDSRTTLQGNDWVAELRIPYSAIRFSAAPEQVWGLNFGRQRRSTRQKFFWNPIQPQVDGFVNQWGVLSGLRDLKPPLRLSLTPYVSAYVNHFPYNQAGQKNTSTSFNGGADVKWGINESFTLDATLVPDFGQVQSDNQVLNLSPFEVQFNENRQFFTEGTELFNKGDLFYSRRVGATPIGFYSAAAGPNERIVNNPAETPLLNATKISGRTSKGLGVGIFNALSNNVYATLENEDTGEKREMLTQPRTNYNIFVLDQSLKNNSFVSLINTNVTRAGSTYDANVTGGLLRLANKKNSYALDARVFYSRRRGMAFNSDTEKPDEQVNDRDGYKYYVSYGKISGNFTWNIDHGIESNTYNPNDLGLLFSNNEISQSVFASYNIYKPFWKVNRLNTYAGFNLNYLYKPTLFADNSLFMGMNTTFAKSFITVGLNMNGPITARNDYFEPRRDPFGRYFVRIPPSWGGGPFLSTDYRKALALDVNVFARVWADDAATGRTRREAIDFGISPRYRASNKLNFRYSLDVNLRRNNVGYVIGGLSDGEAFDRPFRSAFGSDPLLGRRNITTISNTVNGAYTFSNRMSFTVRVRHYVSNVHYRDFSRLRPNGVETPAETPETLFSPAITYNRNRDNTFNAFNVDAVYSWWFAPGSQVSIVWKNAGFSSFQANEATPLYFDNLNNTINTPHNNNVSVKVLYFLDYLDVRPKRRTTAKPQ